MPTAQQPGFAATVLDTVIGAIRDSEYGNFFRDYIYGNPEEELSADDCPLFIAIKEESKIIQETTVHDKITYSLLFRIVIDKYHYSDTASDSEVMTFRELENMIEGQDETTGQYLPSTILGILRNNFTINGYAVNQEINVKYGKVINPLIDEITREAQIAMTVEKLQFVGTRT